MEWGRAKTILIVSFLCLNVLLGYQLWVSKIHLKDSNLEIAGIKEEMSQLMREKGIRLEAPMPAETPNLKEITVKFNVNMIPDARMELSEPIAGNLLLNQTEMGEVLKQQIPHADAYQFDFIASAKEEPNPAEVYILNQLYGSYPMFDVRLKLYHMNGAIRAYWQSYVEVHPGSVQKEQKVLSAATVIRSLIEKNHLQYEAVIQDVRLGYHGQIFNSETQVLAPFWRIVTEKGDVYYVHAINGAVEGTTEGAKQ